MGAPEQCLLLNLGYPGWEELATEGPGASDPCHKPYLDGSDQVLIAIEPAGSWDGGWAGFQDP